jgi:hypothetical protein
MSVTKQNYLLDKTWQFRARYHYYDGRKPTYGTISQLSYVGGVGTCGGDSSSLGRCFDIRFYAGSWMVEKIEILFRNCNGNVDVTGEGAVPTDWYLYDTVYKYDTSNPSNINVNFWQRVITLPDYTEPDSDCDFNDDGFANTWVYRFCGDKQCAPVPVADTNRIYDDLGITSEALTSVADKLVQGAPRKLYDNLPTSTLKKIQFTVDLPSESTVCPEGFVKIFGYIVVHNCYINRNEPIHLDDDVGKIAFGGIGAFDVTSAPYVDTVATDYNQNFGTDEDASGFLIGLRSVSGNFYTRTIQRKIDSFGTVLDHGVENSTGDGNRGRIARNISDDAFYAQYYELFVPKGKYILETYSHTASINDPNFRNTSTYNAGYTASYEAVGGDTLDFYGEDEIVIDACDEDVDVVADFGYIIISDLTRPEDVLTPEASVWYGYLSEKNSVVPIELADFIIYKEPGTDPSDEYEPPDSNTNPAWRAKKTDRNGFYWFTVSKGLFASTGHADFYGFQQCSTFIINTYSIPANPDNIAQRTDIQQSTEGSGLDGTYNDCANIIVEGHVNNCSDAGLQGVEVVMTHMRATVTDVDGRYAFKVHAAVYTDDPTGGKRENDVVMIAQNGQCFIVLCDTCDPCIYLNLPAFDDCAIYFLCDDGEVYTYFADAFEVDFANVNIRGLKSGTRYQMCAIFQDFMGRTLFAQTDESYFIDTPFITDTLGVFAPSVIRWKLNTLLNLPDHIKWFSLGRTKKTEDYIQWALSSVAFTDAKGVATSSVGATYIEIGIDGMLNYNTLNNFRTNTTYQFVEGDRIRFIDDGSGTDGGLYTSDANGGIIDLQLRARTDEDGTQHLIVNNDTRLSDLKIGAWVEIYRPKQCDSVTIFYEFCNTYAVIDGNIVDAGGNIITINSPQNISTFDTYFTYRAIPQKNINGFDSVFTTYHPYEHYAPSDFWGNGCQDIGRIFTENKDAKQTKRRNEISYSDNFVNNGLINGFATWRSENVKDYSSEGNGGYGTIKAIHANGNVVIVVCELDWFVFQVNPKYAKVDSSGNLVANPNEFLSDPNVKTEEPFGCDIQSAIKFFDGYATWYDTRKAAFIICNYQSAKDVARGLVSSYMMQRTAAYKAYSGNGELYDYFPVMGYDPKYNHVILTWFTRYAEDSVIDPFINNERDIDLTRGETLIYDLKRQSFLNFGAFTPEYFSQSMTGGQQQLLISFKNGVPYVHNRTDLTEDIYNTFFGVATDSVFEVVFNIDVADIKTPLAIDLQSTMKWYVDRMLTDIPNADSIIPPIKVKQEANVWHSEVLRNINTIGGLYKGKVMRGFFARIRFVRDNSTNDNVSVPNDTKRKMYSELDNILIKFVKSKRSGE